MRTEAAMEIERAVDILDPAKRHKDLTWEDVQEACAMGAEALKKQIPMEPEAEADGYADGEFVYDMFHCPACGALFEDWEEYPHHCICGQKIDWSRWK